MLKIGLIDDHETILLGLESHLKSKFDIVFTSTEPKQSFKLIKNHNPDILVIDIVFPKLNYIDFYLKIRKEFPQTRIISYTSLSNPLLESSLKKIGVFAVVNKNEPLIHLENTIKQSLEYEISKSCEIKNNISLSKSEYEVVAQLALGKTTKEIALNFNRSYKTIDNHRTNILNKMNVSNVGELIATCYKMGILVE